MTSSTPQPTPDHTVGHNPVQPAVGPDAEVAPRARRSWRASKGRRLVAAGAVVAGLAVGGAGFGVGYAVGHDGSGTTGTDQAGLTGQQGFPGGPMGDRDVDGGRPPMGQMGGTTGSGGDTGGTTGQEPDFDGDGQPDTDSGSGTGSGTDSGSTSGTDSSSQNS